MAWNRKVYVDQVVADQWSRRVCSGCDRLSIDVLRWGSLGFKYGACKGTNSKAGAMALDSLARTRPCYKQPDRWDISSTTVITV